MFVGRLNGWLFAAASIACILAACGGGGGSHGGITPPAKTTSSNAHLTLKLTLPSRTAASAKRLPKYISTATQGAEVMIAVGGNVTKTTYGLVPGTAPCTTVSNGAATCTLVAPFPTLTNTTNPSATVTVNLYDENSATGVPSNAQVLSTGTITTPIAEGVSNVTVPLVLSGVVEGILAGTNGTLATGGTAGQTTFTVEPTDADANIILASDGAVNAADAPVAFTLTVPPSITGVTIADLTQGSAASTSLSNVKAGDSIAIASTSATALVVGVPIEVQINTTPLGVLRIPSVLPGGTAPVPASTAFPNAVEIAGVPPWGQLPGAQPGAGVVVAYQTPGPSATPDTFDANPATTYTGLTIAQNSVPTVSFTCGVTTITGPEQTVLLHLAMGSGTNLVAGENIYSTFATYSLDTIGLAAGTNTCSNSGDGFSNYYSSAGGIEDVAADGVNVAGLFGPQSSDYFIVTTTQTANVTEPIYVNSPGLMDSLGMWYGQIAAIQPGVAAGLNDFIFINIASGSSGALEQTTGNLVPVAAAPDNAGNEYVLANNGYVYICPLGAAYQTVGSCANATYVGNLIPSTNHRALAVGPDGNPWIATSVGLVRAFVSNDSALTYVYGNKSYTQVVASGDGHLYALRSNGQTVDIFP